MATVNPVLSNFNNIITWTGIVTGDTITEAHVPPGIYNLEIKGTWGGATVKILWGLSTSPTLGLSQDGTTEMSWTADSPVVLVGPLSRGFMKPSVSGGAANSITVTLSPAPTPNSL